MDCLQLHRCADGALAPARGRRRSRCAAGLNLPDRLWLLALLGVLGAVALSALGRRGLEGLAFLLVVLVANGVVIWFGRSEVGAAAATEARYLGALTLGFWVAVAIAVAPSPRGPWLPLPDVRGRVRPGVLDGLAAAALVVVCAWAADHYLGRLADGFRGSQFTLQTSAAARGLAYRLDRDLDRLDRSGDLDGLVNGEVPFPFYYDRHPINQVGFLGRAFNDDVEAEGRGPQLFMLNPAAEIKPATFTAAGPPVRRRCDGRCELVLRPRGPAAPTFVRLRLRSGERVTATTTTLARALAKNAPPAGTDAAGKTLYRWDLGPVDARRGAARRGPADVGARRRRGAREARGPGRVRGHGRARHGRAERLTVESEAWQPSRGSVSGPGSRPGPSAMPRCPSGRRRSRR